ncbi:MAG: PKD domain-containing protein [Rhodoferax sp.]|nr:PKD domain-containing protein [Rhodoferax sp.]HQZ06477.1 PKD domain-containing protein [Burkholderiaceae bacterium]
MKKGRWLLYPWIAATALLLVACGGGGGGGSTTGDIQTNGDRGASQAVGLDRFLLNPNPLVRPDQLFEVGEVEYANAYYEAIDPTNAKDTLAKWKLANNIGVTSGGHTEYSVIIGDQRDLGYGRRMVAHRNPNGTLAFLVENYLVGAYGGYTPLNLEAAINRTSKWHLGTNAIEFSPGPKAGTAGLPADGNFVKFYTYDPVTEQRLTTLSLDGRPDKAMPTVCTTCHGGRGDPLTPPDPVTGKKLFAKVMNGYSQHRGDMQAQLHPFEPASFDYSTIPGFSRSEQEAAIKAINKLVLCSMPLPTGTVAAFPEDNCRRVATKNEYQGTAAVHLKDMYGGDGLPNATSFTTDTYVEPSWSVAGQSTLYLNVQAQACRVCHLLRGTGNQSDIDFDTFQHFDAYKDRIKVHVVDRGNMPLAKLIYDKYWSTPGMFQTMGTYLGDTKMPGRPIADPGPDRVVKQGASTLSAAMSLFSSSYQWSLLGGPPGGAVLTNATSAAPTFTATQDGTYEVRLVASNSAGTASAPATLTIVVDSTLPYTPTALRFAQIKTLLQAGAGGCDTCHRPGGDAGAVPAGSVIPPIWYVDFDRAATGDANDATNLHWLYTEVRGRINFTDIVASPLLRKPSGNHHNGGSRPGFNASQTPGNVGRADYDMVLNWILNGAPE